MKIASGSATWNPEATSHTLAVLSLPLPAGLRAVYQSTPYSRCSFPNLVVGSGSGWGQQGEGACLPGC